MALGLLRVTRPRRTAADCLATLRFEDALDLWAWVSTRQVLGWSDLEHEVTHRAGMPGNPQLRRLAAMVRHGAVSGGEMRLHDLLRAAGITGWIAGVRLHDVHGLIGVVDVVFQRERIVIEVDGRRGHSAGERFVTDRRRQNRLLLAGYLVLRFTWDDLCYRPEDVIGEIRNLLSSRRAGLMLSN